MVRWRLGGRKPDQESDEGLLVPTARSSLQQVLRTLFPRKNTQWADAIGQTLRRYGSGVFKNTEIAARLKSATTKSDDFPAPGFAMKLPATTATGISPVA
jgi:hypothetical protein